MKHMTNDKCCRLAMLLHEEQPLSREEMDAVYHILYCSVCTRKLKRALAVMEALERIGTVPAPAEVPVQTAVFRISVPGSRAGIRQRDGSPWRFARLPAPAPEAGRRRSRWMPEYGGRCAAAPDPVARWKRGMDGTGARTETLVDTENGRTFLSFDPRRRRLTVCVDAPSPRASVKAPDGSIRRIPFEIRGGLYCAELYDLIPGEYELILEKI